VAKLGVAGASVAKPGVAGAAAGGGWRAGIGSHSTTGAGRVSRNPPLGADEGQAVARTARAARSWRSKAVGGESRLGAPKWNPWA